MKLNWDAAPGAVRKYTVTYKPRDGDPKEVWQRVVFQRGIPLIMLKYTQWL